jgi:HAD superfamily hydrolase (TIGR01509 family)
MSSIASITKDIAAADDLPQRIGAALRTNAPQSVSRSVMAPQMSYGRHAGPAPVSARAAAVILLLFRRDHTAGGAGEWHLPLIERPAGLTRHGGQIGLPGGAVEPGELSSDAALRELDEELGFDGPLEILGRLSDCYVFASDFAITPWVAAASCEPQWRPHDREVQAVVELPLPLLLDDRSIGQTTIERGPLVFRAPCLKLGTSCVWGATSVIVDELAVVLRQLESVSKPSPFGRGKGEGEFHTGDSPSPRPSPRHGESSTGGRGSVRMDELQPLRAVVFDLDGLIANTEDLYEKAGETVLARRGKTYDAPLREQMMGRPVADALQIMIDCHALADPLETLLCECKEEMLALISTSLEAMPGLYELLDELRAAKVPIAVATSGPRDYAAHVLTQLNVLDRFQFVLTANDIHHGKPDPEVYLLAAKTLGLPPAQMMVLEDSGNGCRAAVAAGAYTVAVPNRHTHHHPFPGANFIAETLRDARIRQALGISHDGSAGGR